METGEPRKNYGTVRSIFVAVQCGKGPVRIFNNLLGIIKHQGVQNSANAAAKYCLGQTGFMEDHQNSLGIIIGGDIVHLAPINSILLLE